MERFNPVDSTKVTEGADLKLHKELVRKTVREGRRFIQGEFVKSPELKDMCGEIISFVHDLAHDFGSKRNKVPLKHIHFVDFFSDEKNLRESFGEDVSRLGGRTYASGIQVKI